MQRPDESAPSSSAKRAKLDTAKDNNDRVVTLNGGTPFPSDTVRRWREAQFCDVTVRVIGASGSREFEAHRLVLAHGSDFFSSLFGQPEGAFADSASKLVDLPDMEPDVFGWVVEFLYCGTVETPEANLTQMLEAAARLQIASLKTAATKEARKIITPEACLKFWDIADRFDLAELEMAAKEEALNNFQLVAAHDDFSGLPLQKLKILLSSQNLEVESEEELYRTVKARWVDLQQTQPAEKDLLDLFQLFRYPLMSQTFCDGILETAKEEGNIKLCALLCQSFMKASYGEKPTLRGAINWFVPHWYPAAIKAATELSLDLQVEMRPVPDRSNLIPVSKLINQGTGKWAITMKLLADHADANHAISSFGFISKAALDDVYDAPLNLRTGHEGLWMLRRFRGVVYSGADIVGTSGVSFAFPSVVEMRIDTDACTAHFFVNGSRVRFGVAGIKLPVYPFAMNYSRRDTPVKVRLLGVAPVSEG